MVQIEARPNDRTLTREGSNGFKRDYVHGACRRVASPEVRRTGAYARPLSPAKKRQGNQYRRHGKSHAVSLRLACAHFHASAWGIRAKPPTVPKWCRPPFRN